MCRCKTKKLPSENKNKENKVITNVKNRKGPYTYRIPLIFSIYMDTLP